MDFYFWRESLVRDLDTALERARAGAAWLDERHGPHWDRLVDVETVDIASPFRCVLGQLSLAGVDTLIGVNTAVDGGFSCGLFSDVLSLFTRFPTLRQSYEWLNEAWRIVLLERRETDASTTLETPVARPRRAETSRDRLAV